MRCWRVILPHATVSLAGPATGRAVEVARAEVADVDAEVAAEDGRALFEPGREDLAADAGGAGEGLSGAGGQRRELRLQGWVARSLQSRLQDGSDQTRRRGGAKLSQFEASRARASPTRDSAHSLTVLPTAPRAAPRKPHPLLSAPIGSSLKSSMPGKFRLLSGLADPPPPPPRAAGPGPPDPNPPYLPPCEGGK